jgi:hypothetical protein
MDAVSLRSLPDLAFIHQQRILAVQQEPLKCISILAVVFLAAGALADGLEPLDACGALAAAADGSTLTDEMVRKLSDGHSMAEAVAKCNKNKELCQRVRNDLNSRKIAIPKRLTCSK